MRLINAEDVIIRLRVNPEEWGTPDESWLPEREYAMVIMTSPEIDPVKHARWEYGKCSNCGGDAPFYLMASAYYRSNYCPNCGAKMDGENDEVD